MQEATLDAVTPRCSAVLIELSPKLVWCKAKTFSTKKSLSELILCSSFNIEMPLSFDETAATAASMQIFLAAPTVTSSGVF